MKATPRDHGLGEPEVAPLGGIVNVDVAVRPVAGTVGPPRPPPISSNSFLSIDRHAFSTDLYSGKTYIVSKSPELENPNGELVVPSASSATFNTMTS
jgi:hypothetical protein